MPAGKIARAVGHGPLPGAAQADHNSLLERAERIPGCISES
jgi:hypothetical protein